MGLRNRWNYSGYPYFVTTTVVEWVNVFKDKNYFDILCESLIFCKNKLACRLLAYCLMPNHVHLILWPGVRTGMMRTITKTVRGIIPRDLIVDTTMCFAVVLGTLLRGTRALRITTGLPPAAAAAASAFVV